MNWTAVAAIGQVVGAAAVVGTLIYLSMQIRLNTAQSRVLTSQAVDTSNQLSFDPIYLPVNSEIWTRGHKDPASLTEHEQAIFDLLLGRVIGGSFNTTSFYQSQGAYDDELFRTYRLFYQSLIVSPGGSMWYQKYREILHSATRNNLENEIEGETTKNSPNQDAV